MRDKIQFEFPGLPRPQKESNFIVMKMSNEAILKDLFYPNL